MQDNARRSPPERPVEPASRQRVGWREILTREYLPQLLTLCLAIWLHAANSMLTATTMPDAVRDIGGLRLISWAFALYLMGSIVAATAISVCVASYGLRRTMMASTLVYTLGCAICAAAPAMPVLLAGRTVQGLGGGALVALVYIAQDRFFPNRLVPRIIACLSVVWTASALCGPLSAGHSPPPACGATPSGRSPCRACCSRRRCIRCWRGPVPARICRRGRFRSCGWRSSLPRSWRSRLPVW